MSKTNTPLTDRTYTVACWDDDEQCFDPTLAVGFLGRPTTGLSFLESVAVILRLYRTGLWSEASVYWEREGQWYSVMGG